MRRPQDVVIRKPFDEAGLGTKCTGANLFSDVLAFSVEISIMKKMEKMAIT